MSEMPERVILWGAVGQAKLIREVVEINGGRIVAVFDDNPKLSSPFEGVPIFHGWKAFLQWTDNQDKSALGFCIGLNSQGQARVDLHQKLKKLGLKPLTLIHPSATIARDAVIGEGSQVMAGVVIGPEAKIGRQCIINTRASVDHDCVLEDGAEISPGATLCGLITVGANAWVAAGATVLPLVKIGPGAIVGAGAVVNKAVPPNTTVVGVPAKPLGGK